ncbi:MFS transporter [Actinoplanes couchii]|uniref:MFS transporter n=1 Tax=Actinoplanes couchii TaxID=403638 RepID=A0ABQ3XNF7_9ACTN|nr:MFS transporter [Actinoplanes couchii]MDR6318036.1 putative MFS family arabinose efflux permease [Actinoplanes couchii]GID60047.1 MFS transporter [Actinoplanes couchii]
MWDTLVHHRPFRRLWIAATIDAAGTWLLVMAVPLHVYTITGSATSTGVALAVQALPAVMIGPWAGVLIDRWPRRIVFVVANIVAALGVSVLLPATTADRIGFVYPALVIENIAVCFLRPALQATIPATVTDQSTRASANALLALSHSVLRICGPLAGTYLTASGWFAAAVAVDVAGYLTAAAILATLKITPVAVRGDDQHPGTWTPALTALLVSSWLYWTANAALTALLVPFAVDRLHGDGQTVGHLITGLGIGYLCGAAASRSLLLRRPARNLIAGSYALVGLSFLFLFTAGTMTVALLAITVAGIPGAVAGVATTHHVQSSAPPEALGRVSAVFMTSDAVAAVAGALAAPMAVAVAGLPAALIMLSGAVLLAAVSAMNQPGPRRWPVRRRSGSVRRP